jgi:hypothetical protein
MNIDLSGLLESVVVMEPVGCSRHYTVTLPMSDSQNIHRYLLNHRFSRLGSRERRERRMSIRRKGRERRLARGGRMGSSGPATHHYVTVMFRGEKLSYIASQPYLCTTCSTPTIPLT